MKRFKTKVNGPRADRGGFAVDAFQAVYPDGPELELSSLAGDLVAEVLHYCHREHVDPELVLRMGRAHYEAEA